MLLSVDSCWASESRANDLAAVIVECSGITRGFTFSLDPLLAQSDKLFFSPSAYWAEGKLEDVHQTSVFEKDCSKIAKKWTKPI